MHRPHSILIVIAAILFALTSCRSLDSMTGGVPTGAYRYVGSCPSEPCVEGWLLFSQTAPENEIRGTWHLEKIGKPETQLGPQEGDGKFAGAIDAKGVVNIDLNPGTADNNVRLEGSFDGKPFESRLRGTWTYSSFIGVVGSGAFSAEK